MSQSLHPCLSCGVCCCNYRVEFSVYELQSQGGTVPDTLAHEVSGNRWRMNGTSHFPIRCVALTDFSDGHKGCGIYEQRSRPCRDFPFASYGCHDTRSKYGLPALSEEEVRRWSEAA
ncbi:YkgJ family cysteine cluster protein [Comamonas composti]|uniref:YkgJ family cysteine cluster protein n=1 Tax=Comamonas composti TaxID=408558 RepID=UPI0004233A4B|nr:YkgJ family cysteine cluster protein [Comamonas composti]